MGQIDIKNYFLWLLNMFENIFIYSLIFIGFFLAIVFCLFVMILLVINWIIGEFFEWAKNKLNKN